MIQIFNYNAGKGDCIRLRYIGKSGEAKNIMVDSGVLRADFGYRFKQICNSLVESKEQIDIFILTHIDNDHIGGLLWNLRRNERLPIKEVWMNHGRLIKNNVDLSLKQNDEVYTRLYKQGILIKSAKQGSMRELDGAIFRIIGPSEENLEKMFLQNRKISCDLSRKKTDYNYALEELMEMPINGTDNRIENRISIVFELELEGKKFLFTGDAWGKDIITTLKSKKYDMVKLPHHGSIYNISEEWSDLQCNNFMICTDGKSHPDKQTIAKLLKWKDRINIYASNNWWENHFLIEEDKKYLDRLHFIIGEKSLW